MTLSKMDSDCSAMEINKSYGIRDSFSKVDETNDAKPRYIQKCLEDYHLPPVVWNVKDIKGLYSRGEETIDEIMPQYVYDMALDGKCYFSDHVRSEFEKILQEKLPANSKNPNMIITAHQKALEEFCR